jgi:hypothetical protein
MKALSSALTVRKGLRKLLLKTHPDFFGEDKAKQTVNEQSLASLNALVDGATRKSEGSTPTPLPRVIKLQMHFREGEERYFFVLFFFLCA